LNVETELKCMGQGRGSEKDGKWCENKINRKENNKRGGDKEAGREDGGRE